MFKHLLPRGRAWTLSKGKTLTAFFQGLSENTGDYKTFVDLVFLDIFPDTTRQLDLWESSFALPNTSLTEQERRDRLSATWQAQGGQSVEYIQKTLRDNGFDVYVHEALLSGPIPGVPACVGFVDPLAYLDPTSTDPVPPLGYALVNGQTETIKVLRCGGGEPTMQGGEPFAQGGEFSQYLEQRTPHEVLSDLDKRPYFLYIGGPNLGDLADIPAIRRNEFESLSLKIKPGHVWLGMLVEYI